MALTLQKKEMRLLCHALFSFFQKTSVKDLRVPLMFLSCFLWGFLHARRIFLICASLCYILLVDFFVIREVEDFTVLFWGCFHVFFSNVVSLSLLTLESEDDFHCQAWTPPTILYRCHIIPPEIGWIPKTHVNLMASKNWVSFFWGDIYEKHMGVSKNNGVSPQIIHLFIGFSMIFTIHFG